MTTFPRPTAAPGSVTDTLIRRLCEDLRPADPGRAGQWLRPAVLAALGITVLAVLGMLGLRPDLPTAIDDPVFWLKLGTTIWCAAAAALGLDQLATPGAGTPRWTPILLMPLALLGTATLVQHAAVPAGAGFWLGQSWRRCSLSIFLLSLPPLGLLLHALRRQAPTRRRRTGLAAGVVAGGLAAATYSLSCGETSAGFVLLWYGLGVAGAALTGWIFGPPLLRW